MGTNPTEYLSCVPSQATPRFYLTAIESYPGVLFKALTLLVKNYTQLYAHTCQINPNPTNQIRAWKGTPVL